MDRFNFGKTALLPLACLALAAGPAAAVDCTVGVSTPVSGRITNNLQAQPGVSTLGTMELKLRNVGKMTCGLLGQPAVSAIPPQFGGVAFTHTISCDDKVEVEHPLFVELAAHSQLTLDTQGQLFDVQFCNGVDASAGIAASFIETSTPQSGMSGSTGRGLFTGVTQGLITVEGTINCVGSVDMEFGGEICLLSD